MIIFGESERACTKTVFDDLRHRLVSRTAVIGVIGLGYVGLPLALRFCEAGLNVIGFDTDREKTRQLMSGRSYITYIEDSAVKSALASGFSATTELVRNCEADALIVCVPTPLSESGEPDLGSVLSTAHVLKSGLRRGQLISLESTTYPGTTQNEFCAILQGKGLKVGEEFFLVYSPERQDPGNGSFNTRNIPKVVGGITPACRQMGEALYALAVDRVVPVSSTQVAEFTKLMENAQRAVNIGLANELKMVADRMGIDIFEAIDAAATKPFGFVPYHPGPGVGGHCIPIDPLYLSWKSRQCGMQTRIVDLVGEINRMMPEWVVEKTVDALQRRGKSIRGSRILILGVAYKRNIEDVRESPALELICRFQGLGADVEYSDPLVPQISSRGRWCVSLGAVALTPERLAVSDAVLLIADHDAFDFSAIVSHASLVIDTRGRYRNTAPNIVRA
jgi:UDP-N-acetyl-D-glucosamine dehydrogenase